MSNFQYVLLVDSNYIVVLVYEYMIFFILRLPFIDDGVADSESEKDFCSFTGLFLSIESFRS